MKIAKNIIEQKGMKNNALSGVMAPSGLVKSGFVTAGLTIISLPLLEGTRFKFFLSKI
ncbi:hypothetical protein [Nostoc sp. CCY0012]|uniref:hypothetical protein n=1 Tax=Nostoc sp. CCY0012 TaxID=1056123 RepID=UPI0039C5CF87